MKVGRLRRPTSAAAVRRPTARCLWRHHVASRADTERVVQLRRAQHTATDCKSRPVPCTPAPSQSTQSKIHMFNGPFSGTTRVSRYQKGKPIWISLKQETVSSSGISWVTCKSAPRSRRITMPATHHSVFTGRMPSLTPNQQHQSTEASCSLLCPTNIHAFSIVPRNVKKHYLSSGQHRPPPFFISHTPNVVVSKNLFQIFHGFFS